MRFLLPFLLLHWDSISIWGPPIPRLRKEIRLSADSLGEIFHVERRARTCKVLPRRGIPRVKKRTLKTLFGRPSRVRLEKRRSNDSRAAASVAEPFLLRCRPINTCPWRCMTIEPPTHTADHVTSRLNPLERSVPFRATYAESVTLRVKFNPGHPVCTSRARSKKRQPQRCELKPGVSTPVVSPHGCPDGSSNYAARLA